MSTPKCSLCDSPVKALGYCIVHYERVRRYGSTQCLIRPPWKQEELIHLRVILDRTPDGLAHALPGELVQLALIIDRSRHGLRSKLHELRAARKAAQNRAILTTE